jgi:hypothetical protein
MCIYLLRIVTHTEMQNSLLNIEGLCGSSNKKE